MKESKKTLWLWLSFLFVLIVLGFASYYYNWDPRYMIGTLLINGIWASCELMFLYYVQRIKERERQEQSGV